MASSIAIKCCFPIALLWGVLAFVQETPPIDDPGAAGQSAVGSRPVEKGIPSEDPGRGGLPGPQGSASSSNGSTPNITHWNKNVTGSREGTAGKTGRRWPKNLGGAVSGVEYGIADAIFLGQEKHPNSPFGVGFGRDYKGQQFMTYIRELNVRRTKIYLYWHNIEPQNNVYTFDIVDDFINQVKPGDETLLCVYTSSPWGAEGVGDGYPPRDYNEYYWFIYDLVTHCKGKIHFWQRDAEPATPGNWDENKPQEYVQTQIEFYNAVKDADPTAIVVGGGHSGYFIGDTPGSHDFFEYFLFNGHDHFDWFDVRLYREIYNIPARIKWFRDTMADYGYQKPIIATEYGGPHPCEFYGYDEIQSILYDLLGGQPTPEALMQAWIHLYRIKDTLSPEMQMFIHFPSPELEAKRNRIHSRDMVQRTILALSSGVQYVWYWMLMDAWHPDLGPHPLFGRLRLADLTMGVREVAFLYYQEMVQKLEGITSVERLTTANPDIYLFLIKCGELDDFYILWERRPPFDGEDWPPTIFTRSFPWPAMSITDLLGRDELVTPGGQGSYTFAISNTPAFLKKTEIAGP